MGPLHTDDEIDDCLGRKKYKRKYRELRLSKKRRKSAKKV